MKTINTSQSAVIECSDGEYRIVDIKGIVPNNKDCIITGWYIKKGKIVKKGKVLFVPGNKHFIIRDNVIEF
jgi:hypothetical protein